MSKTDFIGKASTAAGGWGALKSVGKRLLESGAPISGARTLLKTNQPDGFDCPGCAWGDPEHGSSFEFCENGVKAVSWEATEARVPPDFFASRTVSELRGWSDYDLEKQGRLTHPMRYDRASDKYLPVSWDDAFAEIGRILNSLDSPDRAEFYTSGRASNEAAFLYQLMVRLYGTNNFPDCSNMCHEASGVGLKASRISNRRTPFSSSGKIPAPTIPACWATCAAPPFAALASPFSTPSVKRVWNALPTRRTRWR